MMDSTLKVSRAYYLRAGKFVIASIAQPIRRGPGVISSGQDFGNRLFVFDGTGRWIHSPGENAVPAPPDVRAVSATAGNVVLEWTNRAALGSYLVKRAAGTGSYTTLATIPGTATWYVDTTAAARTTYRYQLVATGKAGTTTGSNEVAVTVVGSPR